MDWENVDEDIRLRLTRLSSFIAQIEPGHVISTNGLKQVVVSKTVTGPPDDLTFSFWIRMQE